MVFSPAACVLGAVRRTRFPIRDFFPFSILSHTGIKKARKESVHPTGFQLYFLHSAFLSGRGLPEFSRITGKWFTSRTEFHSKKCRLFS
jgi:hypothetical protein